MQKLPNELIKIILRNKWFNARVERLERILVFPNWVKNTSSFLYLFYESEIDFNEKRYTFIYVPHNGLKVMKVNTDVTTIGKGKIFIYQVY